MQVYDSHFPFHRPYGDITEIDTRALPDFDLLVGGFPCQAFSVAGRRRGFADARGTLFFDLARILQAKTPRHFVFENVKGLLSHDGGRTFKTIVSVLVELGYDLQWQVLNSRNFGVPQNRERVYIVGHSRREPGPEIFPLAGTGSACPQELASTTVDANYGKGIDNHGARTAIIRWVNKTVGCVDDCVAPTLRASGGTDIRKRPVIATGVAIKSRGVEPREDGLACCLKASESGTKNMIARRTGELVPCGTPSGDLARPVQTGADDRIPTVGADFILRRLTPLECERLQAFPDNWTSGISDTQRYRCLGNAVTVTVASAVLSRLIASLESTTEHRPEICAAAIRPRRKASDKLFQSPSFVHDVP